MLSIGAILIESKAKIIKCWSVISRSWLYEEPMTKSEAIPSADESVNYNDFMTSRINSNYSFVKTEKIESGIAQTSMVWSSNFDQCDITIILKIRKD